MNITQLHHLHTLCDEVLLARGDRILKEASKHKSLRHLIEDDDQFMSKWKGAGADVLQKRFHPNTIGSQAIPINRARIADKMKEHRRWTKITKPSGVSRDMHGILEDVAVPRGLRKRSNVHSWHEGMPKESHRKSADAAGLPTAESRAAFDKKKKALGL